MKTAYTIMYRYSEGTELYAGKVRIETEAKPGTRAFGLAAELAAQEKVNAGRAVPIPSEHILVQQYRLG